MANMDIEVDLNELSEIINDLTNLKNEMDDSVKTLELNFRVADEWLWTGEIADKYWAVIHKYKNDMDEVGEQIRYLRDRLKSYYNCFAQTEANISEEINKLN